MMAARIRFVPIVLNTILSYMQPADVVVVQTVNWQFWSACMHFLSSHLAKPTRGMFILKWPFFGSDETWLQRFYGQVSFAAASSLDDVLDFNAISVKIAEFFVGLESLVLNAVIANPESYVGLSAMVIDLRVPTAISRIYIRRHDPRWFAVMMPAEVAGNSSITCTLPAANACASYSYLLFNYQLWTRAIAVVADQCASNLRHFLFFTDSHEYFSNKRKFYPAQFWTELGLDRMLSKMTALETLHLPALQFYEGAFRTREQAWEALHALPLHERLPNLRRVMIDKYSSFIGSGANNVAKRTPTCGLPDFPISPHNMIVVPYGRANAGDENEQIAHQNMVFPQENTLSVRAGRLRSHGYITNAEYAQFMLLTDVGFAKANLQLCLELVSNRQCMFSVWHDIVNACSDVVVKTEKPCLALLLDPYVDYTFDHMLDAAVMQKYRQYNVRLRFTLALHDERKIIDTILTINREGERGLFTNADRLMLEHYNASQTLDDCLRSSLDRCNLGPDRALMGLIPKIILTIQQIQLDFIVTSATAFKKYAEKFIMNDMRTFAEGIIDAKRKRSTFSEARSSFYSRIRRIKYFITFTVAGDEPYLHSKRLVLARVQEALDNENEQLVQNILTDIFRVSNNDKSDDDDLASDENNQCLMPLLKSLTVKVRVNGV